MSFKGIRLWALGLGIASLVASVQGSPNVAIKKINLPRIPTTVVASNNLPRRDAPLRVAALRVEFVRDKLSTTTGNGGFDYGYNDSNYFDPPPHDSLYFADHIEFQNFYWDKMSSGNLGFSCTVFPAGSRAAYQLPKQMWQYNYNNGAAQLDKALAELFRDAIQAADSDLAVVWNDYDLVIIFHAGAGAEFDLGYTTTPHDLPSAWMVPEDFRSQLSLPRGIPVDGGARYVSSGLILPETETHEGVQISMAGVISLMIGHWLGLPALYDKDEGDPVVGKWSMMDRGFGNFYGALPAPVDVWSASKMGWMTIPEAATGGNQIYSRFYEGIEVPPFTPRAYRIPVSSQEEFILECRYRGDENDTVAYAWDRDGRRMTFNDDYSVTVEPGFRVPVRADNLDFDSPGSGILIWHHDAGLDALIPEGRFNSVDEVRGLDLEEADGAQDIGRNYPFLTPGWGTDYGIFEDAWYGDNSAYKAANRGQSVSFNNDSYPNSRSNSGAFTHVKVDSVSRRGNVMGFRYRNDFWLFSISTYLENGGPELVYGEFDSTLLGFEFAIVKPFRVEIYDLRGNQLRVVECRSPESPSRPIVRDVNYDGLDEIIWCNYRNGFIDMVESDPQAGYLHQSRQNGDEGRFFYAIGGNGPTTQIVAVDNSSGSIFSDSRGIRLNASLTQLSETAFRGQILGLHRFGTTQSDTFIAVSYTGDVYLWTSNSNARIGKFQDFNDWTHNYSALADFNADGTQDVVLFYDDTSIGNNATMIGLMSGPLQTPNEKVISYNKVFGSHQFLTPVPVDIDNDGHYEAFGNDNGGMNAIGVNGAIINGFPWKKRVGNNVARANFAIGDFKGNSHFEFAGNNYDDQFDFLKNSGVSEIGYPIIAGYNDPLIIPTDSGIVVLIPFTQELKAFFIPSDGITPFIWWQGPYRDNDHSNAVWEPATPFAASPGAKLLEDNLCYNWPNPAKGESTAIRYTLNFPATVSVEIFDIAGDKVATLSGPGEAGVPNEIIWNLRNVARGAYLAVVEANGNGKTERKTVKIAVVK